MLESLYLVMVIMLLPLGALDLFVCVSNDAVNFLNSAVGARIAPLVVVMITASAGVLLGATFSSGMMEVARRGMFHPELFTYREIMFLFVSVMLADVILLNVFNSLGLPTSTTVSIIFELLGAAVFTSFYKLNEQGLSYSEILNYIKLDRTATIVSAILLSVVIAFVAGMIVQFVCRLLFTFKFERTYKYLGGLFTGVSLTAIAYFLIFKGAKGASFMKPEYLAFMKENLDTLLWGLFIGFTVTGQLMVLLNRNVFRLIILSGTFALAFSFAGNDLVNFVGVPLAALDGYNMWQASGMTADMFMMDGLNTDGGTPTLYLFLAGAVMCVTLWVSKKARQVVQTSINLSSSTHGEREQFGASAFGRIVTRVGLGVSRTVTAFLPRSVMGAISGRYEKAPAVKGQPPLPFDYVRASINLVVASALISAATSFKLPLSTTYVTFMVAMGTSFADGAWDRESAVYRISGVITVVAGWFLTGFCAFLSALLVAMVLFCGGTAAVVVLFPVVFGLIIYGNFIKKSKTEAAVSILKAQSDKEILETVSKAVPAYYDSELTCLSRAVEAFFADNETALRKARNKAHNVMDALAVERSSYYSLALDLTYGDPLALPGQKPAEKGSADSKFFFYHVFSNMLEASKSVHYCIDHAFSHVANRHTIFDGGMKASLTELLRRVEQLSADLKQVGSSPDSQNVEAIIKHAKKLNRDINRYQVNFVAVIGTERVSMHTSEIYLTFLQSLRDLANRFVAVAMQERALAQLVLVGVKTPIEDSQLQPVLMQPGESGIAQASESAAPADPAVAGAAGQVTEPVSMPKSPAHEESAADKD